MIGFILQLVNALAEPLVGVQVVEGDAGLKDINQGESLVFQGLYQDLLEVVKLTHKNARHKGGAGCNRQTDGINRFFNDTEGRGFSGESLDAGRRSLSGGQTVNLVVVDKVGYLNVAAHSMQKMVAADSVGIAVSGAADYFQFVIGQPDGGGHRQNQAVDTFKTVSLDEVRVFSGTADAGDQYREVRLKSSLADG